MAIYIRECTPIEVGQKGRKVGQCKVESFNRRIRGTVRTPLVSLQLDDAGRKIESYRRYYNEKTERAIEVAHAHQICALLRAIGNGQPKFSVSEWL